MYYLIIFLNLYDFFSLIFLKKRGFKLRLNSVFNPLSKIKVGDGEIKVNEMQHYYYPSLDVKS